MQHSRVREPWNYTREEFEDGLLFHGSSARWITPWPEVGSDGVFWATDSLDNAMSHVKPNEMGHLMLIDVSGYADAQAATSRQDSIEQALTKGARYTSYTEDDQTTSYALAALACNELFSPNSATPYNGMVRIPASAGDDALGEWHYGQVVQAVLKGKDVPAKVLESYYDELVTRCEGFADGVMRAPASLNSNYSSGEAFGTIATKELANHPIWESLLYCPRDEVFSVPSEQMEKTVNDLISTVYRDSHFLITAQCGQRDENDVLRPVMVEDFLANWEEKMQAQDKQAQSSAPRPRF